MARVTAKVTIDESALERETGTIFRGFHASLARRIANQARVNVPVDTGRLGRSIREMPQMYTPFHVDGGVEAGGGAENVHYAVYVHEGTRPHRIVARRAQFLHFWWQGREQFRKSVWHPGTRARPFLRNAGRQVASTDPHITMGGVS